MANFEKLSFTKSWILARYSKLINNNLNNEPTWKVFYIFLKIFFRNFSYVVNFIYLNRIIIAMN
jgi:hypothetical protein